MMSKLLDSLREGMKDISLIAELNQVQQSNGVKIDTQMSVNGLTRIINQKREELRLGYEFFCLDAEAVLSDRSFVEEVIASKVVINGNLFKHFQGDQQLINLMFKQGYDLNQVISASGMALKDVAEVSHIPVLLGMLKHAPEQLAQAPEHTFASEDVRKYILTAEVKGDDLIFVINVLDNENPTKEWESKLTKLINDGYLEEEKRRVGDKIASPEMINSASKKKEAEFIEAREYVLRATDGFNTLIW